MCTREYTQQVPSDSNHSMLLALRLTWTVQPWVQHQASQAASCQSRGSFQQLFSNLLKSQVILKN